MKQKQFILKLLEENSGATIVGSLGTISRDLEELDNGKNCVLLIRGAMGCCMGVGLGMALSNPKEKVIVLIGDGAFLMKMGSISTILKYKPKNLKIIIIQNDKYQSCGGQKINFKYIKKYIPKCFAISR